MLNEETFLAQWMPIEIALFPTFIRDRMGLDFVKEKIKKQLQYTYLNLTDATRYQAFLDFAKVEGASLVDYQAKIIETPYGALIVSLRYIGGDLNKPAIFIDHQSFEIKDQSQVEVIGNLLKKAYGVFKPQRVRWYVKEQNEALCTTNNWMADIVYIGQFLDEIKQHPLPPHFEEISIRLAKDVSWYSRYEKEDQQLKEDWPAFVEMGQLESKDSLIELKEKNFLFEIMKSNEIIGILAVEKEDNRFMNGYTIYEEFLWKKYRGKGLAKAAQRHLAEVLPHADNEMLLGTIHHDNQPSIKTALGTGRKLAGMYIFAAIQ